MFNGTMICFSTAEYTVILATGSAFAGRFAKAFLVVSSWTGAQQFWHECRHNTITLILALQVCKTDPSLYAQSINEPRFKHVMGCNLSGLVIGRPSLADGIVTGFQFFVSPCKSMRTTPLRFIQLLHPPRCFVVCNFVAYVEQSRKGCH